MEICFWISLFLLYYIYDGYLRLLGVLSFFFTKDDRDFLMTEDELPFITVLVTVYNEEAGIRAKILNVLECNYPAGKLELLVASDGSTDGTDDIVSAIDDSRVTLFRPEDRNGKTDTQNRAIESSKGELIVFTDADTRMESAFLEAIARPFKDERVGGVDGHLRFVTSDESSVSTNQGFYWAYELKVRQLESRLGILAVSSGACMAVRKSLFRPMRAAYGEDCLVPLDVVEQGYRVVHATDACATDRMEHDSSGEFKTRVRMTLRNWTGTWSKPRLLNPLSFPAISFALWSHKLLRWLSPLFLISFTLSSFLLVTLGWRTESGLGFYIVTSLLLILFYIAGLVGWRAESKGRSLKGAATAYSFLLANAGFLIGLLKAVKGDSITSYR